MGAETIDDMASAADTASYFEKHSVEQLFDDLVKELAIAKPEDPKAWLAARFGGAAAARVTPDAVLARVNSSEINSTLEYAAQEGVEHEELLRIVRSLTSEEYTNFEKSKEQTVYVLTEEGEDYATRGSPEARLWHAMPTEGIPTSDVEGLCKQVGTTAKIAQGKLMSCKWATMDKKTKMLTKNGTEIVDRVQALLKAVQATQGLGSDPADLKELKSRKCVVDKRILDYKISKGARFALEFKKLATDITPEMIAKGTWKTENFKKFNFADADGVLPMAGCLHPLLKVREECRNVFLEMGFEEMPTSRFVESSFWNFDALFQPQQHPARDSHDTFFLDAPANCEKIPKAYMERVREVHQTGGYGSTGYQYEWSEEETRKNILRTHTTAVSSRMLYAAAQEAMKTGEFVPKKYFSIDRVFRNENLDKTHLAEFHQIEGLVMDRNMSLGDLMGVIAEYFVRIGMVSSKEETKFKPAYNPYTEPSMEIFGYHPELKSLIEVGNSGLFRPEMLKPMGLPDDVSVIAWGLSLERPTMIKYGIKNIRDLFGSGVDLGFIQKNEICRFDVGLDISAAPPPPGLDDDAQPGDIGADDLAKMRAAARAKAAEFAASLTPEEQAIYGAKMQVAAAGVRPDSDSDDDGGADFCVGGADDGVMLGDY